jgi:MFS family permease
MCWPSPAFARLAEIAGRKTLYLCGFALFGVFSALCGIAPNLPLLIAFRVLQGIGGSMLGANSVVILVAAAGPARRAKALGIMAAAQAVGLSLGPTLGGVLLATFGWRSIFWIAVPFAILGAAFSWLIVPNTTAVAKDRRFDASGAALLVPVLTALLMTIAEWRAWGPSAPLIACVAAGPILLGLFIWREGKAPAPLIDLRLFGSAAFSAGCIGVLISYAMLYGMFFAMSFALIRGYHDPAFAAGLRLTIVPVTLGLVAPFGGVWSDKRPRLVMAGGMAVCLAAALALTRLLAGTVESLTGVKAALAAYGAGLGLYIAPNNSATIGAAPADKSGVAGGLLNLLRVFGTGVGVAAGSTVLGWGMENPTGGVRTANASEAALLSAVGGVLLMLSVLGAIGMAATLVRDKPKQAAGRPEPAPLAAPTAVAHRAVMSARDLAAVGIGTRQGTGGKAVKFPPITPTFLGKSTDVSLLKRFPRKKDLIAN